MYETTHLEASVAKYSKEQIYAAIDAAVEAFGLESLIHQQREAICEWEGRVYSAANWFRNYFASLSTVFDHLRAGKNPSIMVSLHFIILL